MSSRPVLISFFTLKCSSATSTRVMRLQCAMLLAAAVASASTHLESIQAGDAPYKSLLRSGTAEDDDGEEKSLSASFINKLKPRMKFMSNLNAVFAKTDRAAIARAELDNKHQSKWMKMSAEEVVKDPKFDAWISDLLKYSLVYRNEETTALGYMRTKFNDQTILSIFNELEKKEKKMIGISPMKEELLAARTKTGVPVRDVKNINKD